jgi:hypothetical protein
VKKGLFSIYAEKPLSSVVLFRIERKVQGMKSNGKIIVFGLKQKIIGSSAKYLTRAS